MSEANGSHGATLLRVLLLVLLVAQTLVRSQLTPPLSSFHCFGEMCYQEAKFSNHTAECRPGEHHCELIQLNTSYYTARCSLRCEGGNETSSSPCLPSDSSTPSLGACMLQCCSSHPLCLVLEEPRPLTIPEDKLLPTPPLATTTSPAPKKNGKICATFSCQGSDCFKGEKAVAVCPEDLNFCELKRSSSGYAAGCSQTCMARIPTCHWSVAEPCYQECFQVSTSGSCLQLDGNLHINQAAAGATRSPMRWALAGAALPLLHAALLPLLLP